MIKGVTAADLLRAAKAFRAAPGEETPTSGSAPMPAFVFEKIKANYWKISQARLVSRKPWYCKCHRHKNTNCRFERV